MIGAECWCFFAPICIFSGKHWDILLVLSYAKLPRLNEAIQRFIGNRQPIAF